MITIGVPLEIAAKTSSASSGEEQKLARGDLWRRPRYFRRTDDDQGGMFHSMFRESCHKLGFDPDDPQWSTGLRK